MFGLCFLEAASPKSTFSSQSPVVASEPEEVIPLAGMSFSPALMEVLVFSIGWRRLQWLIPLADGVRYCLQDLVVAPVVALLIQGFIKCPSP